MRTSRTIVAFLTLSSSKIEEVWQNCCVFKLAGCRQTDGRTDGGREGEREREKERERDREREIDR